MVMDRCHAKDTFTARQLKVRYLDDDGQGFQDLDAANDHKQQFRMGPNGRRGNRSAKGKGTGIAHENLGRMMIIDQKAKAAAYNGKTEQTDGTLAGQKANGRIGQHHKDGYAGSKAVKAIGQVYGIGGSYKEQQDKKSIPSRAKVDGHIKDGNPKTGT